MYVALLLKENLIIVNRPVKSACGTGGDYKSWFPLPQEMCVKMLNKL